MLRERSAEIYGERGLPYPPFLIADCDDMTHKYIHENPVYDMYDISYMSDIGLSISACVFSDIVDSSYE